MLYKWDLSGITFISKVTPLNADLFLSLLDSSQDYTDSTGIDLHEFLVNTLKGNPRFVNVHTHICLPQFETLNQRFFCPAWSHKRRKWQNLES